jgi:hypothetical protein
MVNHFQKKSSIVEFFAGLCGMNNENPYVILVCPLDFAFFLKLFFYLNCVVNQNGIS